MTEAEGATSAVAPVRAQDGGVGGYAIEPVDLAKDGDSILQLLREGFSSHHMRNAKFDWYYRLNPAGPPLVSVLRHGPRAEPVGTAAAGLRRVRTGDGMVSVRVLVDFVVTPGHRTFFPALLLQRDIKRRASEDCEMLIGTPNRLSEAVFGRVGYTRMGWTTRRARVLRCATYLSRRLPTWLGDVMGLVVDRIRMAAVLLRALANPGFRTEWLTRPDDRFDDLWRRTAALELFVGVRDRAFLHWRFVARPMRRACFFALVSDDPPRLVAYAVCESKGPALHVRDFLVDPTVRHAFGRLWAELSLEAFSRGYASLSTSFCGPDSIQQALSAAGMIVRDRRPVYAASTERWAASMNDRNWYLTSADEDE